MYYDPIMCMMVEDKTKAKVKDANPVIGKTYEIMGKKFKVAKVDGNNVTVISENGIVNHLNSAMFNNAKALDNKAIDKAVKACDASYSDFKEVYNILAEAIRNSTNTDKMVQLISKAQGKILELAVKPK